MGDSQSPGLPWRECQVIGYGPLHIAPDLRQVSENWWWVVHGAQFQVAAQRDQWALCAVSKIMSWGEEVGGLHGSVDVGTLLGNSDPAEQRRSALERAYHRM